MSQVPALLSPTPMPRVKFLLVDDLEENLIALSALLRRDEVELLQARSGQAALELLLEHEVALAFLDVQMPEMDGFELAELIRGSTRTRHVPLIFVTAGASDHQRVFKGYENGAVDFLYKPIDPHILRSKAEVFFQLHRQRQQLAHELQERTRTLRMNEMFTAILGHDLRDPLNAIVLAASVLQQGSDDPKVKQISARMLKSGKRMGRMVEDMLDLSRARLGAGFVLSRRPTQLDVLVDSVIQEHGTASPQCRIELHREGALHGEWDADRLSQVISNLIGNALQHGEDREPVLIELDGRSPDTVVMRVRNAGRIPDDVLPDVFDPFRSGPRRRAEAEGLGLGLYIVEQVVLAHGGGISVELPEGGLHTVFCVTLPRQPGADGLQKPGG